MDFDYKMKVWLHYVVKQCYLNAELEIVQKSSLKGHKIKSFDDFCNDTSGSSESLKEYYWRFEKEINKFK